ncbi:septin-7-like isoform X1 [Vespa mandarinia]|uniref:septin-7-like isoform X1 n=1 Tax=Vespa mandarinia TaxID=7446 RepID=UPI00161DAB82|nr:septin-7-like isoform X1 [Vespa mandarinia]XP_035736236.1 septin-7-like isoform X1 [Vespa mandarinia]XP_035736237.1 septin-7-like isoform X1 [Vespa mandarinia]XP_035736238.1 septin-7-like isoform X1 [Vespa mandarinia]XP_035736239.1 septin-7-like isoform X1 [Vespa mandarinia]XP_035736240.1 septin-7-like isoform X1 [Vespa mandarinia]XP_035736242.1 septin-7-like isoform X1 [Vespa mandarinia]XP_035736243.1 septin-7-like isoform X1 [Vespa mandarinia]XP_035736244.1 septin-7-like isoform X1 [Ve
MSTENQQNGSAGPTQSNGLKSATINVTGNTRTIPNNSSFLYSSNSMLNRDKPRQVPPPTLPKYTSSFNAGSNGSGAAERLSRDREAGGSYRLASLERLALRQRILDGEKANGDATSIQAKRELFFKGDSTGIISSPSVPSVPPPQPPGQASSSSSSLTTTSGNTTTSISTTTTNNSSGTTNLVNSTSSNVNSSNNNNNNNNNNSSTSVQSTSSISSSSSSSLSTTASIYTGGVNASHASHATSSSIPPTAKMRLPLSSSSTSTSTSSSSSTTTSGNNPNHTSASALILNQNNDPSEDSNKRESARSNNDSKDSSSNAIHHRPLQPLTKSKELDGYVGFANLPNQVYRKAVKKGFDFTIMVVGRSGLGKSTFINSMFLADIYSAEYPGPSLRVKKTVAVETTKVLLKENGVNLTLTVVDTPGFGDAIDNSNCWVPVIEYIESKYEEFLNAESRVTRRQIPDSRVHCCLYFIAPSGHDLTPLDVEFMQRLHDKVNIIPVIAKADTMTPDERAYFKKKILNEIAQHKIKIYEFPEEEYEEDSKFDKVLRDRVPFAVVGANTVVEHDGKKVRGRNYPWGIAEVENLDHCDFIALRDMIIRTHLQDLQDVTNNIHYENFRCRTLAGLGVDGKPTKISNKNPLAQLEEEKREHDNKMKKMEIEMEQVFEMKVREKKQKLKDSEADLQRRHEQMRRSLEQQVRELEEKRRAFEAEKLAWEQQTGHSIEELRRRSLEANSKETGSVSSEGSGGGGGTLRGSRGIGSLLRRHTSFKSPQESPTQIQLVIQHPD